MSVTVSVKQSNTFAHALTYQHDAKSKVNIIYFPLNQLKQHTRVCKTCL